MEQRNQSIDANDLDFQDQNIIASVAYLNNPKKLKIKYTDRKKWQ